MFPNDTNGGFMISPDDRTYRAYQKLADGQGAGMVVSPLFYRRGQAGPNGTATFAASAASGTSETASIALPAGMDPPEYVEVVFINHADAAITVDIAQTVDDFVSGSGTVNPSISSGTSVAAGGGAEQVLLHFPFTTDGALVITFTASAAMTAGGDVGAQIRWMA